MLRSSNKIDTNKYEVEIGITPEQFERAIQATYQSKKAKIAIPGFRKGKVPRKMIEKMYGEGFFYEDAINNLLQLVIPEAMDSANLEPVATPQVEVTSINKLEGVVLKATAVCKPEVSIEGYKGIEVTKENKEITDEDVDAEINRLRDRQGRLVTVEDRAAQNGDVVVIDFEGFIDGKAFEGGKENNYELKLGTNYFIPGFEDQIVGHSTGDEFTVNVTFPENYQMPEVAGKPAEFSVKLHEIKSVELPDIDDEFVKDVSEFDTLDELKADLRKKLEERNSANAQAEAENKLFEQVAEKVQAEIPEEMIQNKIDDFIREFEARISQQGLNLEMYLSYMNLSGEAFRETYRTTATKQVKLRLGLEKIAELENTVVSAEEVENEYLTISKQSGMPLSRVKSMIPFRHLEQDLKCQKASEIIKESAVIS